MLIRLAGASTKGSLIIMLSVKRGKLMIAVHLERKILPQRRKGAKRKREEDKQENQHSIPLLLIFAPLRLCGKLPSRFLSLQSETVRCTKEHGRKLLTPGHEKC
jgi:hypothetical protein